MLLAQLSDPHVTAVPLQGVVDTARAFERAVRSVLNASVRPDAALISGDLVEHGDTADYALLRDLLAPLRARMPVYLMAGNHDGREALLGSFPDHDYLPAGGFIHYAVPIGAVRLVACDSVVAGAGHGALCAQRLDWLDRTLGAEPDRPTIVAIHHPPFLCGIAFMDRLRLLDGAADFAAIIARHAQVQRVICGHVHRAIVTQFATVVALTAPSTAHQIPVELAPAAPEQFVFEPPGWYLHRWDGRSMQSFLMSVERTGAPVRYV